MKRRIFALVAICVMVLSVCAQAAESRAVNGQPTLYFDGTTAVCSVTCKGTNTNDELDVTLTLYQGSTVVDSWSDSGNGRVQITGRCGVDSGESYTLRVYYSVNGVAKPMVATYGTCP